MLKTIINTAMLMFDMPNNIFVWFIRCTLNLLRTELYFLNVHFQDITILLLTVLF